MSILDRLITNRTEASFYGAEDLNRVGEAMQYVAARLRSYGYDIEVAPQRDWQWTDRMTPEDARRYLDDLQKLREALKVPATTPPVPKGTRPFNAQEANNIEMILLNIDRMLTNIADAWFYSGEIYAGEFI